jgi:hypothetical protein
MTVVTGTSTKGPATAAPHHMGIFPQSFCYVLRPASYILIASTSVQPLWEHAPIIISSERLMHTRTPLQSIQSGKPFTLGNTLYMKYYKIYREACSCAAGGPLTQKYRSWTLPPTVRAHIYKKDKSHLLSAIVPMYTRCRFCMPMQKEEVQTNALDESEPKGTRPPNSSHPALLCA